MLSQGWTLLRVKGGNSTGVMAELAYWVPVTVHIKPELAELRDHLKEALWTTFDDAGMSTALGVLRTDSNR